MCESSVLLQAKPKAERRGSVTGKHQVLSDARTCRARGAAVVLVALAGKGPVCPIWADVKSLAIAVPTLRANGASRVHVWPIR